jgi:hypothetical protein
MYKPLGFNIFKSGSRSTTAADAGMLDETINPVRDAATRLEIVALISLVIGYFLPFLLQSPSHALRGHFL